MNLIFILCITVSALLILSGFLCLLLGKQKKDKNNFSPHTISTVWSSLENDPIENGDTILAEQDLEICTDILKEAPEVTETFEVKSPSPWYAAIEYAPTLLAVEQICRQMEGKTSSIFTEEEKHQRALLLLQNAEILHTLCDGIKKASLLKAEDKKREIYAELKACAELFAPETNLDFSRKEFDLLYPSFFEQIKKISSEPLSELEERLCGLLALGASTKDMSALTRRSVRTVETAVYRIRKKLGIPTEEKTPDFLKKYLL